jgi:hypothetical protein
MSGRFTVFPLLGSTDAPPPYLLLDEALAKGVARVKGLRASEEPTTDAPGRTNEWSDAHGAILRDENAIPRAHPELDGVLS